MAKKVFSKVVLVGRTATLCVGLAVMFALAVGAATSAVAADGEPFLLGKSNVASRVSNLINNGVGPALKLKVGAGQPPLVVDGQAGTAKGLSADKLDGRDSNQILPLVRAQKDPTPFLSDTATGMTAQTNSVSITAPKAGILVISSNVWLYNLSTADQTFSARIRLDGQEQAHLDASNVAPDRSAGLTPNVTLPVNAGQHTVTLEAVRAGGTGDWSYTSNNLGVMFIPSERGKVTDVQP